MTHAQRCPVCHGSGKLPDDGKTSAISEETCHGCHGRGWVTVQDSMPFIPPPRPAREPEPLPPWHWSRQIWAGSVTTNGETNYSNQTPQMPVNDGGPTYV